MSTKHTVVQGEHLSGIAQQAGFADYTKVWMFADNSDLKTLRQDPNLLLPGDVVVIPDVESKKESRPLDAEHQFVASAGKLRLKLVLNNELRKPIAGADADVAVDGVAVPGIVTSGAGGIDVPVPRSAAAGRVRVRDEGTDLDLDLTLVIGGLDPLDTLSGQIGRLNNMGYDAGDLTDPNNLPTDVGQLSDAAALRLRSAVEEFQCDQKIAVDGIIGPVTKAKLKTVYGC